MTVEQHYEMWREGIQAMYPQKPVQPWEELSGNKQVLYALLVNKSRAAKGLPMLSFDKTTVG